MLFVMRYTKRRRRKKKKEKEAEDEGSVWFR